MSGARRRSKQGKRTAPKQGEPQALPFGGKVQLARRRKPDGWLVVVLQVSAIVVVVSLIYMGYYHHDTVHFHLNHAYANMGHAHAQHVVAHKYLQGSGIPKNSTMAFYWFREAKKLIKYAAENGVHEAHHIYHEVCTTGKCDH